MIVLYHPAQYPLARALLSHDDELELWYVPPDAASLGATPPSCEISTISPASTPRRSSRCVTGPRSRTRTFASECASLT